MIQLIAQYTVNHTAYGFECTAYLTYGPEGLTVHTITRGGITYNKSRRIPVAHRDALTFLRYEAERAPLL
jgi:hypothetical protein